MIMKTNTERNQMDQQSTIKSIVNLIEKRRDEVIKINNLSEKENNLQYEWVKGIYDDMASMIRSSF